MENRDQIRLRFYKANYFLKEYSFKINKITKCHQFLHYHDYFQIWYVKNGTCSHWIHNTEYQLMKGDLVVIPPDVIHKLDSCDCENLVLIGCEFSKEMLSSVNEMVKGDIETFFKINEENEYYWRLSGSAIRVVENLFEEMVFEFAQRKSCFALQITGNIFKLFSILSREKDVKNNLNKKKLVERYQSIVMKTIEYIDLNYRKKITLDEVCKMTMLSVSYFSFIFKEITGRTFTDYVNYLRVQNAIELLSNENLTMHQISNEVGFKDTAYFCRIFKKQVGKPPGYFRKNV